MRAARDLRTGTADELARPRTSRPGTATSGGVAPVAATALLDALRLASSVISLPQCNDPAARPATDGAAGERTSPAASVADGKRAQHAASALDADDTGAGNGDGDDTGLVPSDSFAAAWSRAQVEHATPSDSFGAAWSQAQAEHATQIGALVDAVSQQPSAHRISSSSGGATEGGATSAVDGALDGVLAALQRCRSSLDAQFHQMSAPLRADDLLRIAALEHAAAAATGRGSADAEAEDDLEGAHEELPPSYLTPTPDACEQQLQQCFPAHLGALWGSGSSELREMALDRLKALLQTPPNTAALSTAPNAASRAPEDDETDDLGPTALHAAAAALEAEAAALEQAAADTSAPRFWARAAALDGDEDLGAAADEADEAAAFLRLTSSVVASAPPDEQLLGCMLLLHEGLADPESRVALASLALLDIDGPLMSSLLPRCSLAPARAALLGLLAPLHYAMGARSVRVVQGAMGALQAVLGHPNAAHHRMLLALLQPLRSGPLVGTEGHGSRHGGGGSRHGGDGSRHGGDGSSRGGSGGVDSRSAVLSEGRQGYAEAARLQLLLRLLKPPEPAVDGVPPPPARGGHPHGLSPRRVVLSARRVLPLCADGLRDPESTVRHAAVELLMHSHALEPAAVEEWLRAQSPLPAEVHEELVAHLEIARQRLLQPPPTALSRPTTALSARPGSALSRPSTALLREGAEGRWPSSRPSEAHSVQILRLE